MKQVRIIVSTLLCAGLVTLPMMANADDGFKIANSTKKRISFKINHACSAQFGAIKSKHSKMVPRWDFLAACGRANNCVMDVYASGNCSGKHISTLTLDTNDGVKELIYSAPGYGYSWSHYSFDIVEAL